MSTYRSTLEKLNQTNSKLTKPETLTTLSQDSSSLVRASVAEALTHLRTR